MFAQYSKLIAAILGSIATAAGALAAGASGWAVLAAAIPPIVVYLAPKNVDPEAGISDIALLVLVVIAIVVVLLLTGHLNFSVS